MVTLSDPSTQSTPIRPITTSSYEGPNGKRLVSIEHIGFEDEDEDYEVPYAKESNGDAESIETLWCGNKIPVTRPCLIVNLTKLYGFVPSKYEEAEVERQVAECRSLILTNLESSWEVSIG